MIDNIKEAFDKTRVAGSIAARTLDEVTKIIKPGVTTNEIDSFCYKFIDDNFLTGGPRFVYDDCKQYVLFNCNLTIYQNKTQHFLYAFSNLSLSNR